MGSLKVPALLANVNDSPLTAVRPAGRMTHDPIGGALAIHDGVTPGGDRINRFKRAGVGSTEQKMRDTLTSYEVTPEQFGAVGDGVADDAPAIQRALDHIKTIALSTPNQIRPGVLNLTAGKRYKCGSQLLMDRAFHNVYGTATLDFSSWTGTYVRWTGSYTEFGNGYGQNGCMEGQIVIVGSGQGNASIAILYDTALVASCTHIRTVGVTVVSCGIAFQIGSRGYNQEFINCKAFVCGVIFDWLGFNDANNAFVADDNDERISIFGGTFYNSGLFIRHKRPAGGLYVYSASIDYTAKLVQVYSGKVQWFGVHTESSNWAPYPIDVSGDGGLFTMIGGWFLMQQNLGNITNYINVGAGASVVFENVITNNTNAILTPNAYTPSTWATGAGRFEMRNTQPGFEFGGFPGRLMTSGSVLADGDFEAAALGQDQIWLAADTQPITSRYTGQDIQIARSNANQMAGTGCLRVDKQFGTTAAGAFVLICIPVRYGDRVVGGLRVRTAPDRAGSDARLIINGGFAKLDGQDQYGVPRLARYDPPGDVLLTPPTDSYMMVVPQNGRSQTQAPSWATHWIIRVDAVLAFQASWLFDGLWADRF